MTKAKKDGETPRHCYFWVATLPDGKIIPEYDFENNKYNHTKNLPTKAIVKFSWYPVTFDIALDAHMQFSHWLKIPQDKNIHSLEIDIAEGERLQIHPVWRNIKCFMGNKPPEIKYCAFKTTKQGIQGFFLTEKGEEIWDWN